MRSHLRSHLVHTGYHGTSLVSVVPYGLADVLIGVRFALLVALLERVLYLLTVDWRKDG